MIVHCSYEELHALREGARAVLEEPCPGGRSPGSAVVALAQRDTERVAALLPSLHGDLTVSTLAEQQELEGALTLIVECLRELMDAAVLAAHPADEVAVTSYFEFAHALSVLDRTQRLGAQMRAVIEVVTGAPPSSATTEGFVFPD